MLLDHAEAEVVPRGAVPFSGIAEPHDEPGRAEGPPAGATVIVTVATFESSSPSFALYVKVSVPYSPGSGV